ncbi:hypothetical protein NCCP2140_25400 [Pseudoalteromonas sp. NCCP-2140]|uniref:hypothetical protein n=1 Tax=Pseudoalteromonas sp. NCCP-2140 TaxID=2942288 RepID=UPI00203F0F6A|nr:hypothetical protein [Pseudoalteromonas sp. NCCP-2140]GKW53487.1 hypothetical protein NCCP2140_25400 [Pseudoalteromonas sp. NCCP-2140]
MNILNRDSFKQKQLKTKLNFFLDQKKLFEEIDKDIQLSGAGVIYIDENFTVVTLREFKPICRLNPVNVILREPPKHINKSDFTNELRHSSVNPRESRFVSEVTGTVFACTGAIISWVAFVASGLATPISFGSSAVVSVLSFSAASATTLQCANGILRSSAEKYSPEFNDWLDSEDWYVNTIKALDYISLAGATAASAIAVRTLKIANSSGVSFRQLLSSKSRQERSRITKEIIRLKVPGISNKMLKKMMRSNIVPKRFNNIQINNELRTRLRDSVAAALAFTGSAYNGEIKGIAIGVYESLESEG